MARADLKKVETPWRERVGRVIARAFELAGVTQKEAAALLDRDQAQIARWIAGTERPQFDVLVSVDRLRHPLLLAFAEATGSGVELETTIHIRRIA